MRSILSVLATLLASVTAAPQAPAPYGPSGPPATSKGCSALSSKLGDKVFAPGSSVYSYENTQYWSNTELKSPGCVFRPQSAQDVGAAVKILAANNAPFAVRGGGHMGVPGSNNIDAGVLIVLSNLTSISLNADKSILTLAPGFGRWSDVYHWLQPYNLVVAGGRLGPVGVPGLLLAGGINFHGNQVGFASDTVLCYEVVLADGSIVTASPQKNVDLFWALKGGSSNFGVVTSFSLKTIKSTKVWAGTIAYAQSQIPALYSAIANYSAAQTDPKSHLVPAVVPSSKKEDPDIAVAILLYDSETNSRPACFEQFFQIPNISDSTAFKTVAQFTDENAAAVVGGIQDVFVAGTFAGRTSADILQGIKITNDTFYTALDDLYKNIPSGDIVTLQLDWQPISKTWIDAGRRINPVGSPLLGGFPEISTKTYLAYAEVVEWRNTAGNHDQYVASWIQSTTGAINKNLQKAGLFVPFTYMGDAAGFQTKNFYDGYGQDAKQKMIGISRKYDPSRLFQAQNSGGFKLGL